MNLLSQTIIKNMQSLMFKNFTHIGIYCFIFINVIIINHEFNPCVQAH